ncbi:MAG: hypothetical protein IKJ34_03945, partial [Mailhella sp.]|nr:hypothetical protein [Mailhella sp.]
SIVGTQIMGTVHPRNAFLKAFPGSRSILLATFKTQEHALRLKDWAAKNDGGDVEIRSIPMTVGTEDCAAAVISRIAEEAAANGDRVYFNVDGGLNYLIADCVLVLNDWKPVLLQSSEARSLACDTASGLVECLPSPDLLSVRDILELQNADWSQSPSTGALSYWCGKYDIALPEGCMEKVVIDGITFDLAWNPGSNRINFLKDFRSRSGSSEERLAVERNLTHWASDRTRSAQIYDRKVYAIVSDAKTEHRLHSESCGKIEVCNCEAEFGERAPLREKLRKIFSRKIALKDTVEMLKAPAQTKERPLEDDTLIVSVGTNIVPTLVALRSHKPKHAVLCCTKNLEEHAERIRSSAEIFGLESVRIVRVAVEGSYFEKLLPVPAEGARVSTNITPGTKGHGAMLAHWGRTHGCSVWSIDNRLGRCVPLYAPRGEQPVEAVPCDMETRFRVEGVELLQSGDFPHDELELYQGLLAFMRVALESGKDGAVFKEDVSVEGMSLRLVSKNRKRWKLERNGSAYEFSFEGGEWLEKLAAVAMAEAGFEDVRYRIRFSWPEEIEKDIRQKHVERIDSTTEVFSLDLDTIGSWKNDIVVISCKSNPYFPKDTAADEIAATGERLGRFALRMLLHIGVKKPFLHGEKVMVFGWRTLCQKEEFLRIIENLRSAQRTTEE